ncbi:MAG: hypothetical protein HYU36_02450 [Planctomycetes bacterium]|nr:hypothetical protein [Planctomycetota bacterium]
MDRVGDKDVTVMPDARINAKSLFFWVDWRLITVNFLPSVDEAVRALQQLDGKADALPTESKDTRVLDAFSRDSSPSSPGAEGFRRLALNFARGDFLSRRRVRHDDRGAGKANPPHLLQSFQSPRAA